MGKIILVSGFLGGREDHLYSPLAELYRLTSKNGSVGK